jgi:threonine dehydrogenase-like Zn-dependent dehydrogenase
MRAFVVTAPGESAVEDVEAPIAEAGEVVVDVARVGVCGTDVEFFTGEMAYLHDGHAAYPMRLGHEWCGAVAAVGGEVDPAWIGRRVIGDTMLGCGHCHRCRSKRQHLCDRRTEVGISGGRAGALAEQIAVPASSLSELPDAVDDLAGAMVEPGGNALRAVWAADLNPHDRVLVLGPGTIGLLAARFALAAGAEVHVIGADESSLSFARSLGLDGVWIAGDVPSLAFDAVIDATNAADVPAFALDLVEPGKRVVYIGLAGTPSTIDTRTMALKDVTAVGILSGSPALADAIDAYASGSVDPRPFVAATVGLERVGDVLAGRRPPDAGPGPKIHVNPRL